MAFQLLSLLLSLSNVLEAVEWELSHGDYDHINGGAMFSLETGANGVTITSFGAHFYCPDLGFNYFRLFVCLSSISLFMQPHIGVCFSGTNSRSTAHLSAMRLTLTRGISCARAMCRQIFTSPAFSSVSNRPLSTMPTVLTAALSRSLQTRARY